MYNHIVNTTIYELVGTCFDIILHIIISIKCTISFIYNVSNILREHEEGMDTEVGKGVHDGGGDWSCRMCSHWPPVYNIYSAAHRNFTAV